MGAEGYGGAEAAGGGGSGAPSTSKYVLQQADAALPAAQDLSALATGLAKVTTATGVISRAVPGTDYQVPLTSGTDYATPAQVTVAAAAVATTVPNKDAKYVVQQSDVTLANAQALSALSTGLVKVTTTTGVLSVATAVDVPAGDWWDARRLRAIVLSGISAASIGRTVSEADRGATDLPVNNSGGTVTYPTTPRGGVAFMQTTATNGRYASVSGLSNGGVIGNIKTDRWFFACRAKVSASDAQSTHEMGVGPGVGGVGTVTGVNNGVGFILVNGVLNLQCNNGGTLTTVATSWVLDTTLFHNFEIAFDATTVTAYVDGVSVGSTSTLTNVPAVSGGSFEALVSNGSSLVNRTLTVDKIGCWFDQPA
jgi:hypothetical protein